MISKFFIERPVLANVLAILMMVVGAVALFRLPVSEYPDVVPPTVQVTTRYPGASARTVIDTVALPLEQQINGVEGLLYMQSFSGADGSYSLTVTFQDRDGSQCRADPCAESGVERAGVTAAGRSGARCECTEELDGDIADRDADFAGFPIRQPLPCQLRNHQIAG